jgi:hypothetical protein
LVKKPIMEKTRKVEPLWAQPITKTRNGECRFRNVGLPKGGNSYGNGAFIVVKSVKKNTNNEGKQRFFSSKSNAVNKKDGI